MRHPARCETLTRLCLPYLAVACLIGAGPLAVRLSAQDFEQPPISYSSSTPDNPISRLEKRLAAGQVKLHHEQKFGYLRSVLKELDIPESSQMLVFSKTSLQRNRISPRTPRAIYFSDDVYVGYCQNGEVLEVSVADALLGTVFYTVDQSPLASAGFTRQTDSCLMCHGSSQTQNVPGHLVRSVFADAQGLPILSSGSFRIDHSSPLEKRWGGWYVTGKHGDQKHLGNVIFKPQPKPETQNPTEGLNLVDVSDRFDAGKYLTPHSDLIALMVLEHQTQGHNLIARANFLTRIAMHFEVTLNQELGQPENHRWDSTTSRIRDAGEPLVKYLLMSDEAKLTAPLTGTSGFAEEFATRGPYDGQGRSLRELDLQRRLFKYPCSYLIYSESFDALPAEVKTFVYERLWAVLAGEDTSEPFAHLTTADRTAIRDILIATKQDLPAYWRQNQTEQLSPAK